MLISQSGKEGKALVEAGTWEQIMRQGGVCIAMKSCLLSIRLCTTWRWFTNVGFQPYEGPADKHIRGRKDAITAA